MNEKSVNGNIKNDSHFWEARYKGVSKTVILAWEGEILD